MKVLMSANTEEFSRRKKIDEQDMPVMQTAVNAYNALGLPALAEDDLYTLFADPVSLVFDKMTGGNPVSIAGLQVDKYKAIDILVKPAGYDAFLQAVKNAKDKNQREPFQEPVISASSVKTKFTMSNGNIVFKSAYLTQLEESVKTYLNNDLAQNINLFADDVVTAFAARGLNGKLHNSNGLGHFIKQLFKSDERNLIKDIPQIVKTDNTGFRGNF